MEVVKPGGQSFFLVSGTSFEILAGQFQRVTEKVVCVKDGLKLYVWDPSEVPQGLRKENTRLDNISTVTHYNYRSMVDESLYTFFDMNVDQWLCSNRSISLSVDQNKNSIILPTIEKIAVPRHTFGSNRRELKTSTFIRTDNTLTATDADVLIDRVITINRKQGASMKKKTISIFTR